MTKPAESRFVYVTYIRTTPERLWSMLISPEFAKQYWMGARPEAEWKEGGAWKLVFPDGLIADAGEIVAFEPGQTSRHSLAKPIQAGIQGGGLVALHDGDRT